MIRGAGTRLALLAATLTVAACSAGPDPTARYEIATSPTALVLSASTGGGLVPESFFVTHVPQFALFGDGRAIVPGPVDDIYPSPLLPNLRDIRLTASEVQRLVGAADAAGLLGQDASYGVQGVADAPTTTFVVTVGGVTHTTRAYALGIGGTATSDDIRTAREKLLAFQRQIADLSGFLHRSPEDAAYAATAMRVFTTPAGAADPQGLKRQIVTWPLSVDPGNGGEPATGVDRRCILLTGADLDRFLAVARTANALTVWNAPSGSYSVSVRPLYPNESGCPGAGQG